MADTVEANHPLAAFDRETEAHMRARNTPGGAVAIVRGGKLIYARGYGLADVHRAASEVKEWPDEDLFPRFR